MPYFPTFSRPSKGHLTSSFGLFKIVSFDFISFHCKLNACARECINTVSLSETHVMFLKSPNFAKIFKETKSGGSMVDNTLKYQ